MLTAEAARERLQDIRREVSRIMDNISRVNVAVSVAQTSSPENAERLLQEATVIGRSLSDDSLHLYKTILLMHQHLMPERQTPLL